MPRRAGLATTLGLLVLVVVAPPARSQSSSCLETGWGLYPGWHGLSHGERARRCLEAERTGERLERRRDREVIRELRREQYLQSNPELRRQECLVNAAACDIPGSRSAPPPPLPVPPPPAPPPPPR